MNIPRMTHSQSQSEPPTDSKNFLKVFFTTVSLRRLLLLQLFHQTNFKFILNLFDMVKLRELSYKNPSYTNGVFLSLKKKPSNIWFITYFKYRFKWVLNQASNGQVIGFFMLLIFAKTQILID